MQGSQVAFQCHKAKIPFSFSLLYREMPGLIFTGISGLIFAGIPGLIVPGMPGLIISGTLGSVIPGMKKAIAQIRSVLCPKRPIGRTRWSGLGIKVESWLYYRC